MDIFWQTREATLVYGLVCYEVPCVSSAGMMNIQKTPSTASIFIIFSPIQIFIKHTHISKQNHHSTYAHFISYPKWSREKGPPLPSLSTVPNRNGQMERSAVQLCPPTGVCVGCSMQAVCIRGWHGNRTPAGHAGNVKFLSQVQDSWKIKDFVQNLRHS